MQLELLRENDIGTITAWLPKLGRGPKSMARLTYPHFTQLAFYYSAQQVEQLEFSTQHIQQGNSIQTSVGLWFLSIEAYINSILRISCLVINKPFDDYKGKDFGSRIKILLDILNLDRRLFYTGVYPKLEEFKCYRNEIFHDRSNDKQLNFHKTSFSGNPMYANQVDVMQASVIALETYQAFRYAIPSLDLMPQVMVTKEESFFYVPMDTLYKNILRPYFDNSLHKHSLTSSVRLDIAIDPMGESAIFKDTEVQVLIKATADEKFEIVASNKETHIGKELFDKLRNEVSFDANKSFRVANYYRN